MNPMQIIYCHLNLMYQTSWLSVQQCGSSLRHRPTNHMVTSIEPLQSLFAVVNKGTKLSVWFRCMDFIMCWHMNGLRLQSGTCISNTVKLNLKCNTGSIIISYNLQAFYWKQGILFTLMTYQLTLNAKGRKNMVKGTLIILTQNLLLLISLYLSAKCQKTMFCFV